MELNKAVDWVIWGDVHIYYDRAKHHTTHGSQLWGTYYMTGSVLNGLRGLSHRTLSTTLAWRHYFIFIFFCDSRDIAEVSLLEVILEHW